MKNSLKILSLIAFLYVAFLYAHSDFIPLASAQDNEIGVSVPLTGTSANWGKDMLNAIKFANDNLSVKHYKLVVEDDKCDPKEALAVANKFASTDHLKFVLGLSCSGPLLAAAPVYEKAKIIAISASASAAKISESGDFIFRTWPSDEQGIQTLAAYITKRHHRLGILSEQTEYSQGLLSGMEKNKGDLEIVSEEFTPGTTDFRSLLLRLRQQNIDSIFLNPQGDSTLRSY